MLTMEATAWLGAGRVLTRKNPNLYRVDGLPVGHEALIGWDPEATNPIRWRIRMRTDGGEWAAFGNTNYASPEDALNALRAEVSN